VRAAAGRVGLGFDGSYKYANRSWAWVGYPVS
jgi:hypothetical protein